MSIITPIDSKVNFGSKYNFTILGKNNQHKPLLYNEVNGFIKGKGITTTFEIGKNRIQMGADTRGMAEMIAKGLKKMGIIEGPVLK